jgi:hypothetical protein
MSGGSFGNAVVALRPERAEDETPSATTARIFEIYRSKNEGEAAQEFPFFRLNSEFVS